MVDAVDAEAEESFVDASLPVDSILDLERFLLASHQAVVGRKSISAEQQQQPWLQMQLNMVHQLGLLEGLASVRAVDEDRRLVIDGSEAQEAA